MSTQRCDVLVIHSDDLGETTGNLRYAWMPSSSAGVLGVPIRRWDPQDTERRDQAEIRRTIQMNRETTDAVSLSK